SEERTAAGILARIPAELAIPRPYAVIIIDLAIVELAQKSLIDDGLRRLELAGVAVLETDARFYPGLLYRFLHGPKVHAKSGTAGQGKNVRLFRVPLLQTHVFTLACCTAFCMARRSFKERQR